VSQAAAIVISPAENTLAVFTAASGDKPVKRLDMPAGVKIEAKNRGAFCYSRVSMPAHRSGPEKRKGARRSVRIDPVTAVPKIERVLTGERK